MNDRINGWLDDHEPWKLLLMMVLVMCVSASQLFGQTAGLIGFFLLLVITISRAWYLIKDAKAELDELTRSNKEG